MASEISGDHAIMTMETPSVLLALCEGNPPVTGEISLTKGSVMRSFDAYLKSV